MELLRIFFYGIILSNPLLAWEQADKSGVTQPVLAASPGEGKSETKRIPSVAPGDRIVISKTGSNLT